jgi:arylsulfatase A-like enzyme
MRLPCIALAVEKPNIVFIGSDEVETGDIKCYYESSKVTTTNIEKLATQGISS